MFTMIIDKREVRSVLAISIYQYKQQLAWVITLVYLWIIYPILVKYYPVEGMVN